MSERPQPLERPMLRPEDMMVPRRSGFSVVPVDELQHLFPSIDRTPVFTQEIVHEHPPNIDEIDEVFGVKHRPGILYSFGPIVFNPDGVEIPPELVAHEAIHGARQGKTDAEIMAWWRRYLEDRAFRLAEELEAHRAEYRWLEQHGTRQQRRSALKHVAHRLAAPLYGRMVTPTKAKSLLAAAPSRPVSP